MKSVPWDVLEKVATILGPNCAAAKCLEEAKAFLDLSKTDDHMRVVNFYKDLHGYIVIEKIDTGPEMMGS
jgi:hypothetical protein